MGRQVPGPVAAELDREERARRLDPPGADRLHLAREAPAAAEQSVGVDVIAVRDDRVGRDRPAGGRHAAGPGPTRPARSPRPRPRCGSRPRGRGRLPAIARGIAAMPPSSRVPDPLADDRPGDDQQGGRRRRRVEARVGREAVEQLADRPASGRSCRSPRRSSGTGRRPGPRSSTARRGPAARTPASGRNRRGRSSRRSGRAGRGTGRGRRRRAGRWRRRRRARPALVGRDVEPAAVGEDDPEGRVEPPERQVAVGVEPGVGEKLAVDPGHHDDARPLVPAVAGLGPPLAGLAADLGVPLQDASPPGRDGPARAPPPARRPRRRSPPPAARPSIPLSRSPAIAGSV